MKAYTKLGKRGNLSSASYVLGILLVFDDSEMNQATLMPTSSFWAKGRYRLLNNCNTKACTYEL